MAAAGLGGGGLGWCHQMWAGKAALERDEHLARRQQFRSPELHQLLLAGPARLALAAVPQQTATRAVAAVTPSGLVATEALAKGPHLTPRLQQWSGW